MKIERFEVAGLAQYSYVISSGGIAAVVDPIRDVGRYTDYAAKHGLTITHIFETHIHADFAAGSTALVAATGAELAVSGHDEGEHYRYSMAHRRLRDGESIELGRVRIEALHTPGHTPEHVSFLVFDGERSATVPVALFSGDFLFVGSLGRPDLLGEAEKVGLAHALYRSMVQRIADLPDGVELYPGHGAGSLCGAGLSERAESTLGYERATNRLFRLNEEDFVREILASVPPMPDYYPRMKALNAEGAAVLIGIPGGTALTTQDVTRLVSREDVTVLDVRRPESFGGAHIAGAINIGAGQNLSLWSGWLLDAEKKILLVSERGDDEGTRRALIRVGLGHIEGFLEQGMPSWIDAGLPLTRTTGLGVAEVAARPSESVVLDVRSNQEWKAGHIAGARHIMLGDLPKSLSSLPRGCALITVCGSGYRSSIAASLLQNAGFTDVSSMHGGMGAWMRAHLDVVAGE